MATPISGRGVLLWRSRRLLNFSRSRGGVVIEARFQVTKPVIVVVFLYDCRGAMSCRSFRCRHPLHTIGEDAALHERGHVGRCRLDRRRIVKSKVDAIKLG